MARTLIPRSDSVSAKIIEPSDFENLFSSDIVQDYIKSGFTLSAGSGLACNVSTGVIRFKGLYLENDATEAVGSLTASTTNSIHVKLARDGNGEAESWSFSLSSSGETMLLGQAITDGSGVTSVTTTGRATEKPSLFALNTELGGGTAGDILYSNGTNWTKIAKGSDGQYLKLASGVPTWTTHTTPTTTITHQHDVLGTTISHNTTPGLPGDFLSVTLANRSGGYFIAVATLNGDIGSGMTAILKKGNGGFDFDNSVVTGSSGNFPFTVTATGTLDGSVLNVYGFGYNAGGSFEANKCHLHVLEISQTG